jgi:hypothetical protein
MSTPAGTAMTYCASNPSRESYQLATDGRAFNHLEVAADAGSGHDERLVLNVFDGAEPWRTSRSTFSRLCANHKGQLTTRAMRVVDKDFFNEPMRATLMICSADLVEFVTEANGTVTPISARWWIGSYFLGNEALELPSLSCMNRQDAAYDEVACDAFWTNRQQTAAATNVAYAGLVEATVMIRQDGSDDSGVASVVASSEDFARIAQTVFVDSFGAVLPLD